MTQSGGFGGSGFDPVKQAEQLQQIFFGLSNAANAFRLDPANFNALTSDQQQRLKNQALALTLRAEQCTADTLAAILAGITPHLQAIKQTTTDAKNALAGLKDVVKGLAIVDAAVALAASIMTGDIGSIGTGVETLADAIGPAK